LPYEPSGLLWFLKPSGIIYYTQNFYFVKPLFSLSFNPKDSADEILTPHVVAVHSFTLSFNPKDSADEILTAYNHARISPDWL